MRDKFDAGRRIAIGERTGAHFAAHKDGVESFPATLRCSTSQPVGMLPSHNPVRWQLIIPLPASTLSTPSNAASLSPVHSGSAAAAKLYVN